MSNPYFQFKQFTVRHDRCAMKVGTDGVLLGAWAPLPASGHGLDIGTGTGLVALMAAQRAAAMQFTGIDIDKTAVAQARENVAASPFASRVHIEQCAVQDFRPGHLFQAILCNPPFFEESLLPPDAGRMAARHARLLTFQQLAESAARLLSADGLFSVVLPTAAIPTFRALCFDQGLHLRRRCDVCTTAAKAPKRTLACFSRTAIEPIAETLVLQQGNARTKAYRTLCKDFYLY